MPSARLTLKVCVGGILFKVFYTKIMHHKYSKAIKREITSEITGYICIKNNL